MSRRQPITDAAISELLAGSGVVSYTVGPTAGERLQPTANGEPATGKPKHASKKELLPSVAGELCAYTATFVVGVATYSITNSRDIKAAIGRKGQQRRAVCFLLGKHHRTLTAFADDWLHRSLRLKITLTRLAPRRMDASNNVAAMKHIQDAVAELLGTDDGDPSLHWLYEQEANVKYGVRIRLDKI